MTYSSLFITFGQRLQQLGAVFKNSVTTGDLIITVSELSMSTKILVPILHCNSAFLIHFYCEFFIPAYINDVRLLVFYALCTCSVINDMKSFSLLAVKFCA